MPCSIFLVKKKKRSEVSMDKKANSISEKKFGNRVKFDETERIYTAMILLQYRLSWRCSSVKPFLMRLFNPKMKKNSLSLFIGPGKINIALTRGESFFRLWRGFAVKQGIVVDFFRLNQILFRR